MPTFQYKGFNSSGHSKRGLVEAVNIKEARERLAEQGLLAETVSETRRQSRFPAETRATVYRELSALLKAGIPLVKALDLLMSSPEIAEARLLLSKVRDGVMEGSSLAAALSSAASSITQFEISIIEVAERSAAVELMLGRLADFIDEQEALKEKIRAALTYPVLVVTLGICSGIVILGFLVPMMQKMLVESHIPLPPLTRFTMALGNAMSHWSTLTFVSLCIAGLFYFRNRIRTVKDFTIRWDKSLFELPIAGKGYSILVSLRFARTLSILTSGGVPLVQGLTLAGRATGSAWIAELAEAEAESVKHGTSLSDAVRRIPPLSQSLPGWIQTAEASGGMAELLETASQRYQEHWQRYIDRRIRLLEPILLLLIGGFVLLLTLSVLLPVFSLSDLVGK